ncbi:type II toxin-antitoxin system RatA family toxin [Paracidovorax anthurii]|uniref:Polyketide cyclase/dehydrase/lipid transport protein n=1 Tax=Paracidovorax anthurii TaxID=78229 RepID=A0A328YZU5_9BURK|nr:SRPBCC family protein [Paracidovorax anthurii]RAR76107.1 polyketide cyclase/dehydrase/lipid transport protein [Paracidovorax anthurii]
MRISLACTVARPREALFRLSQDYTRRLEWDIYLSQAHLLGEQEAARVGAECFCKSRSGTVLVSRYITFAPPGHAAVQMVRGPWVLRSFGGTWRFRALGADRTEVRFIYHFTARPALLAWLLEPLIAAFYRRDMRRRLAAFRHWAEAGA